MTRSEFAPAVIVVVGGGPRGTGLLERLCANAADLAGDLPVEIHLVDPYPFGAGRVWRYDQSPLLKTNSMASDVTMFTDESCTIDGPVRPGPTVDEWAAAAASRRSRLRSDDVNAQIEALDGGSFPTRQVQSQYLSWVFWRSVDAAPPNVTVHVHPYRAVDVVDTADGRQQVCLDGSAEPLVADVVVLAVGHLTRRPARREVPLVDFAAAHGLTYVPTGYTADLDLSGLRAGEDVLVRGMGLAFVDLMVLVAEGRGGRFTARPGGGLDYHPSGAEPRLYVGSRRGVPYHAKISYPLQGAPAEPPRYLTRAAVETILVNDRVEFGRDVWPLAAKDVAYAWYRELFTGHPDRVAMPWEAFEAGFDAAGWDSAELAALVAEAVPAVGDRFDVPAFDQPLAGLRFDSAADLQDHLIRYVEDDLRRGGDPARSPALGAFLALLPVFGQIGVVAASGRLTPVSYAREFAWFFGLFNFLASGPPAHRLAELAALARAGVVCFLGADMWVRADADRGVFVAGGGSVDGTVEARTLVEARLPQATVSGTTEPLLGTLFARGAVGEEVLDDEVDGVSINTGRLRVRQADHRVLSAAGEPHPRRFALGSFTNGFSLGAFSRPRTNAPFFRHNDATARRILTLLRAEVRPAGGAAAGEFQVRAVAPDDAAAADLFAELALEYEARYGPNGELGRFPPAEFCGPDGALLLLTEDGRPVAGGAFRRYDDRTAELKRMWTSTRHRRRGLGRRVVAALEEEAGRRGYRRILLTTGPRQPEAKGLYLSAGYAPLFDPAADPETVGPLTFEKHL